ncbi:MAG: D-alanyl-D-alanine carboxypeptidase [Candidatus Pacebacteria bacterium]|nr:D-alanyl-D-alanine carboxypeptidase [Candidatus Paceibacterota bacterium]
MNKLTHNETRLLIIIVVLAVLGLFTYGASSQKLAKLQSEYSQERQDEEALTAFFSTDDNAKAVYVYDATNKKVLYERNADMQLPLASVTKLATALTVNKVFGETDTIAISPKSLAVEGDNGLIDGEVWSRDQLLGFMLVISSNDAAYAFKEAYDGNFMETMNAYAKEIGLENTTFSNPAGLDFDGKAGSVGTARDMSTLILHFLDTMPAVAAETIRPQQTFKSAANAGASGKSHTISNTNDLSVHIDSLLASKTGYTRLAGGNLALAYRMPIYGNTIVIVVLGSTKEGRFVDIERYMEGVENYFKISKK